MIYYYVKMGTERKDIVLYKSISSLFEGSIIFDISYGLIKIDRDYIDEDSVTEEELKGILNESKTRKK